MKMKMPFDGFYLKLLDEQNGTHEYEEYLRNCKENPLTEEEQREWTESARAAIAELERINAEPEPTRQSAEPEAEAEGISSPQTPEPTELQEGCCAVQEAEEAPEVEVVPAEAIVPLVKIGGDAPAEKERWAYASELIDPSTVRDVTKVRVHNNVIWNAEPGNAIELGYALQSEIHDLVFEDCDIIHCQYEGNMGGAAISIHQADGGHVHDIHYKNIRVEQAEQKLFDIKVLLCRYTEQLAKGEINDIYFDNIQVLNGDIPVSIIRGYQTPTEEVRVHDVHFDNITFMGNKCETWQDMRLVTELANDIYVNGVRTCRQMKF